MPDVNPFLLDDEDDDETDATGGDTSPDSKNFKEVRAALRRADKERKAALEELEALKKFKAEVDETARKATIESTFKSVGLSEKHATLYAKLNPDGDVTEDAVKAFAVEYELPTSAGEAVTPPVKDEGFKPVIPGSTPAVGVISIEDAQKLIREGKYDEAQKLYSEGRVEKAERKDDGSPNVDWLEGIR